MQHTLCKCGLGSLLSSFRLAAAAISLTPCVNIINDTIAYTRYLWYTRHFQCTCVHKVLNCITGLLHDYEISTHFCRPTLKDLRSPPPPPLDTYDYMINDHYYFNSDNKGEKGLWSSLLDKYDYMQICSEKLQDGITKF